ncbi:MAG: AraC family transcriptional regulator [Moraxellaceae bacterium]|jgi:AraC-like DNA-binding protein|nr:AraC family transcriptional regulator [Moraxellaceae bacterium]
MKSDSGIFLWMTWQAMQRAGLDSAAIFASVNLPDAPPDPQARRDNATQKRFWDAAERISGNADVGLHVGAHMPPFRGQVMEYLFLSSPTFGEGLTRALRYHRLLTDALPLNLRVEGETAILHGLEHPVRHYLEVALCVFLQFWRHVTDGEFRPREIRLTYTAGATPADYERIYGCPVRLGMPEGALCFDATLLARPSPAAEPQLLAMHEALAEQRLAELERRDLITRIERELGGLLEAGDVSLERVAARLQRNPHTLRRELAAIGTTFNDVVARYRERLARRLLARTSESIDQIVYLTGFSEHSAFTRAFKRWTGETPTDYRRRKQSGAA